MLFKIEKTSSKRDKFWAIVANILYTPLIIAILPVFLFVWTFEKFLDSDK